MYFAETEKGEIEQKPKESRPNNQVGSHKKGWAPSLVETHPFFRFNLGHRKQNQNRSIEFGTLSLNLIRLRKIHYYWDLPTVSRSIANTYKRLSRLKCEPKYFRMKYGLGKFKGIKS